MSDTKTLREALLLCQWIAETPHQRGSINGHAAQVAYAINSALAAQAQAEPVLYIGRMDFNHLRERGQQTLTAYTSPLDPDSNEVALYTAPQPAAQPVADERDEEIERLRDLVIRQGTQLRRIVNIVRGDPAEGCAHSTHDAADLVYGLKMHSDQYAMAVEHEQRAAQPVRQPLTREQEAAHELLEALREIADDYAGRFDLDDPSTNPGIRYTITQARAAIAKATGIGQEGGAA